MFFNMSCNIRLFFLLIIFRLSLVYWLNPFPLTNFKLFPQDYCFRQYLFSPARRTNQIVEKSDFMRRILTKSGSWNDPLLWYNSLFALNTFFIIWILSYDQSRIWMFGRENWIKNFVYEIYFVKNTLVLFYLWRRT